MRRVRPGSCRRTVDPLRGGIGQSTTHKPQDQVDHCMARVSSGRTELHLRCCKAGATLVWITADAGSIAHGPGERRSDRRVMEE